MDVGCGTGRLMMPLLRDGHTVVGLDRSPSMLARASGRLRRASAAVRRRALLLRADLRAFGFRRPFAFVVAAFHTVQELHTDDDLMAFFTSARACLSPGGWLAFDLFVPAADFLARAPGRRWDRTLFRHPGTGRRTVYTMNHSYDPSTKVLEMRMYYRPLDSLGRAAGRERIVRLRHRQVTVEEVKTLLARAGFTPLASYAAFDGTPLSPSGITDTEQHVHIARAT